MDRVRDDLAEGFVDLGLRSVLRESERAPDRLELSVGAFPLNDSVEASFLGLQARRHQIFLCHFYDHTFLCDCRAGT